MIDDDKTNNGSWALPRLPNIARRLASATLTPVTDAAAVALRISMVELERRAVEPLLASPEVGRLVIGAIDDDRVQAAIKRVVESDGAKRAVGTFFDSGLFDEFVERLLASKGLWRLVDDIAGSPAVTAAITQQGLGFVDQVGEEVRSRSRGADDWLERAARRLALRRSDRLSHEVETPDSVEPPDSVGPPDLVES